MRGGEESLLKCVPIRRRPWFFKWPLSGNCWMSISWTSGFTHSCWIISPFLGPVRVNYVVLCILRKQNCPVETVRISAGTWSPNSAALFGGQIVAFSYVPVASLVAAESWNNALVVQVVFPNASMRHLSTWDAVSRQSRSALCGWLCILFATQFQDVRKSGQTTGRKKQLVPSSPAYVLHRHCEQRDVMAPYYILGCRESYLKVTEPFRKWLESIRAF